jgi:hypothetical protein
MCEFSKRTRRKKMGYERNILGHNKIGDGSGIWVIYKASKDGLRFLKGYKNQYKAEKKVEQLNDKFPKRYYDLFEIPTDKN